MLRTSILALALALAGPAFAQVAGPQPALKADVVVTGELVRIGDLVDHAGAATEVAVFRAPDLGQTGTVQTARVLDALRPYRLAEIDAGGLSEIAVTRTSRVIGIRELEDRIAEAIAVQPGIGDAGDLTLGFDREVRPLHVEAGATDKLRVARVSFDAGSGRFDVSLELPGSAAARRLNLRYTGTALETAAAAMLVRPLARGEVIRSGDLVIERRPKAALGAHAFARPEEIVGLAARRALRPAQPLRPADVMKPEIVRQNELVTIFYQVPGIALTVRGKALETGAEGDLVNVVNVQSKRTVQATVTGPGQVTVAAPSARRIDSDGNTLASIPAPIPQPRTE